MEQNLSKVFKFNLSLVHRAMYKVNSTDKGGLKKTVTKTKTFTTIGKTFVHNKI